MILHSDRGPVLADAWEGFMTGTVAPARMARVARCLSLDALTAQAVTALSRAGIDSVLLKGPATVHWLYDDDPGGRNYSDIDLLVDPRRWDEAGSVLVRLGLVDRQPGLRPAELARIAAGNWISSDGEVVDLHRGFHCVEDQPAFWEEVWRRSVPIGVGGMVVQIPAAECAALLHSLHALVNGGRGPAHNQSLVDLRRSLSRFDDDVWRAAADLATRVGAAEGMSVGLALTGDGRLLAQRIGLSAGARPEIWRQATTAVHRGDNEFERLLGATGWWERLRVVMATLLPSPAFVTRRVPWAGRNGLTLVLAYLYRSALVPALLPRTLRNVKASRRLARTSRGVAARERRSRPRLLARVPWVIRAGAHFLRRPDRTRPATLWWTVRALRAARDQLPTVAPGDVVLPAMRPEHVGSPSMIRARAGGVRSILKSSRATCLEEAVVRQRWLAGAGDPRDIVVGVAMKDSVMRAHAWLEGDRMTGEFAELTRYPGGPADDGLARR